MPEGDPRRLVDPSLMGLIDLHPPLVFTTDGLGEIRAALIRDLSR